MGIIGTRARRVEDRPLLTGAAWFTDDLRIEGAAAVHYVRSAVPHGRVRSVRVADAARARGVIAVLTATDLPARLDRLPLDAPLLSEAMPRPWLAADVVRYVGEPIAVVVASSLTAAVDAAELVEVDIEPLPAAVDPEAALAEGAPLLHPAAGTNVCYRQARRGEASFEDCQVVISERFVNPRLAPAPVEPLAAQAAWEGGQLTLWATSQGPWPLQRAVVDAYGYEPDRVRVVSPSVGGGFGAKEAMYPEILLLPWIAERAGRPVRWAETRSESMVTLGPGRGQVQTVTLGGDRDGTLRALSVSVVQDAGAYPRLGAMLPLLTGMVLTGPYRIPQAAFEATAVVTPTTPSLAYRGAGQPEAVSALERAIDLFAAAIDADPADVRRRNLLAAGDLPWRTPIGTTFPIDEPTKALETALELVGYDDARATQRRTPTDHAAPLLGVGLAGFVEVVGGPESSEHGRVEVLPDGSVVVHAGSFSHGQGHHTGWAMVVADRLGVAVDQVAVVDGDTAVIARGGSTGGSRSVQSVGNAVWKASDDVAEQARRLAADLLEAPVDDVVLDRDRGRFHVAGVPAVHLGWAELAAAAAQAGTPLAAETDDGPESRSQFTTGFQAAVVEVDAETGGVALRRFAAVADCGRVLNPMLAEGQLHGGSAQGAAQALTEVYRHDALGNPLTSNLLDYGFISAPELPSFEVGFVDEPTGYGPLGARGLGEGGAIGAAAAVQNAVVDALASLGVRHVDMPCHGEAVWRAVVASR